MNVKERAKRMGGNLHGVLIDYDKDIPKVVISFFAKEIREAEWEVMEGCLKYIELEWLDEQGMLIAVDGKGFLDDVRSALLAEVE